MCSSNLCSSRWGKGWQQAKSSLSHGLINKVLLNTALPIHLLMVYGCFFALRWQCWVIAAETTQTAKPKIFTIWSFTEKIFTIWSIHHKLLFDKWILTETKNLGLTIETFEVLSGSVCEGSHGVIIALFYQSHCFCSQ